MITAYCDGACRVSNPGQASCAFVVYDGEIETISQSLYLGPELRTNNYAEYMGLLRLLHRLETASLKNVYIYCDSKLVVDQVNQDMTVNSEDLKPLALTAYAVLLRGRHKLIHVKGHDGNKGNERADQLCNEALDRAGISASLLGDSGRGRLF